MYRHGRASRLCDDKSLPTEGRKAPGAGPGLSARNVHWRRPERPVHTRWQPELVTAPHSAELGAEREARILQHEIRDDVLDRKQHRPPPASAAKGIEEDL